MTTVDRAAPTTAPPAAPPADTAGSAGTAGTAGTAGERIPFLRRHVGTTDADHALVLERLGLADLDALVDAAVPAGVRSTRPLDLPAPTDEPGVAAELRALAASNTVLEPMLGLGYHGTTTPAVIRRNVLESPAWYTAYTPYQPEISQGRLEALLNFQTVISDLTGLEIANASLLDESTAVAEAVALLLRTAKPRGRSARPAAVGGPDAAAATTPTVLVDVDTLPQTLAVLATRMEPLGVAIELFDPADGLPAATASGVTAAAVVLQHPGASGALREHADLVAVVDAAHERGALVAVAADLLSLTLLTPPGEWGADVVVGSSQRFGVPLGAGGPHAGFMAVRSGLERSLPGRLVGVSRDAQGLPALRLALQTREQHIRRDRATSNICTAQVLLAVVASMYAVHHGPEGLRAIARRVHRDAAVLAAGLTGTAGAEVVHDRFFDTLLVRVPGRADDVVARAEAGGVLLRRVDADHVGVSTSETTRPRHLAVVLAAFRGEDPADGVLPDGDEGLAEVVALDAGLPGDLAPSPARESAYLTHPVFSAHRSETALLRYLRRLSDRDLALDRGMIPLGSCTMKLNATTEMEAIGLPGFSGVHPFAPAAHVPGYLRLVDELETWLAEVTGYAAVSLQPNAGSQGEFAGLLAIRAYHRSRGEGHRDVCVIPSSAHGTNAASAVMAGMRVAVVGVLEDGTVDLDALRATCAEHADDLAAIMVTYPSTHGVYEEGITELAEVVHAHGGQVYVDGANLNALVGIARPGRFGGDVSHLNLHKTFCIPHGVGGPGVGPVAVAEHLVPFLPSHPMHPDPARRDGIGPVSGAPLGSASILPISWAYVRLLGGEGLRAATVAAVLAANDVAARLDEHYPVLYRGQGGFVAHECILDLRPITAATGVTVDDVAKRLVDHGFHAPTVSFPVAGTLMVEPTESEDLAEIDRFVAAMIAIRGEIRQIADGELAVADSPLRGAPHTAAVLAGEWDRPYDRMSAVYPSGRTVDKYWPPVGRIDQAHGDRHLVCSCPPVEDLATWGAR